MEKYELIVIGSGPAGEKAAVKAAYFGYKVAIIEEKEAFGGAGVNTGTIPSKALKETALYLSGKYEKGLYGIERDLKREARVEDFMYLKNFVSESGGKEVYDNLKRHGVHIYHGNAKFLNAHTLQIQGEKEESICSDYIIIATGSYPNHPPDIPFDGKRVHDSDTILDINKFPRSICVLGAGIVGCEYATIFSTIGTKVYLVNRRENILPFLDGEVRDELIAHMSRDHIEMFFDQSVKSIQVAKSEYDPINVTLTSGKEFEVDMFLYAAGRNGATKNLDLEKAGIVGGEREAIEVDEKYKTNIPHIYAVGDVIGFPALASIGMDQGRVAVAHIFHTQDLENIASVFPYGIYTVPEVSMVGMTEEEAKGQSHDFCIGKARYSDMTRGKIMGAKHGFLKLIFHKVSLKILGVHIIGNIASELIHYGMALVEDQKTISYLIGHVFNHPTLHDLYKYAAYDGLSNLTGHKVKP